ncbi:MAG: ArsA family ATPase [Thermoplasmatota archaeon]
MDLLAKRLVIVAGKGGVGKTTTSSAIALHLAKQGKKTLLVTVDPAQRLADSLGVPVGFKEAAIQPNLFAMMLDPKSVITEHLQREIPEAEITEHPMFRYVAKYMPGLNELMAIGKLNDFRREGKYDIIVVDTAPTGHALSFLSAPGAIRELMSEKSLIKWAIKGYAVWQKLSSTMASAGNLFKKKEDRKSAPPDIDFEKIFADIEKEAQDIQSFITNPDNAAFVVVTLPEKMPVQETIDLHRAATDDLGMEVHAIVVNKMQPDAFRGQHEQFAALLADRAKFAGKDPLRAAILQAAEFGEIRRGMNLAHLKTLQAALKLPMVQVPLFKQDVTGLAALAQFQEALFDDANLLDPDVDLA